MKTYSFRDLTLIDLNDNQTLVISCDSAGGIGDKELDVVKTSQEIIGYFTTTVALMEMLSYRAKLITLVNNLSVEMHPAGEGIIKGIERALKPLNLDRSIITGSTEENIPVRTTGLGITAIGIVDKKTWVQARSKVNDLVVCLGIPKVGDEVVEDKEKSIMNIDRLLKILDLDYINEILPVGSKGIEYELKQLATTNGLGYDLFDNIDIDLKKTAGPSTCVLVSTSEENYDKLIKSIDIKITKIARLKGERNENICS